MTEAAGAFVTFSQKGPASSPILSCRKCLCAEGHLVYGSDASTILGATDVDNASNKVASTHPLET